MEQEEDNGSPGMGCVPQSELAYKSQHFHYARADPLFLGPMWYLFYGFIKKLWFDKDFTQQKTCNLASSGLLLHNIQRVSLKETCRHTSSFQSEWKTYLFIFCSLIFLPIFSTVWSCQFPPLASSPLPHETTNQRGWSMQLLFVLRHTKPTSFLTRREREYS